MNAIREVSLQRDNRQEEEASEKGVKTVEKGNEGEGWRPGKDERRASPP